MISFILLFPIFAFASDCESILVEGSAGNAIVMEASGEKAVLEDSQPIQKGASIVTGHDAWVDLRLCDGSGLRVGEKSKFKFEEAADEKTNYVGWAFELIKGSMLAVVQGDSKSDKVKMRIRTKSAAMGIRGTEFLVECDESEATSLHTIEGEVLLGSQMDFEQMASLSGKELSEKFEPVRKESTSRIAKGERRAQKAAVFQMAEFRLKRQVVFGRKLERIAAKDAGQRIVSAVAKREQKREQVNAKATGKDSDKAAAGAKGLADEPSLPGEQAGDNFSSERKKDKKENKKDKDKREDPGPGDTTAVPPKEKSKDLNQQYDKQLKDKSAKNPSVKPPPPPPAPEPDQKNPGGNGRALWKKLKGDKKQGPGPKQGGGKGQH